MKTLVCMLVMVVFLWNKAKSQTNFPDSSLLDKMITTLDKNKNNKISSDELSEYFAGGKAGSVENIAKVIKMLDQDGDNEASKDELLKMAKKIIEFYINIYDLDNDGALSEREFEGKSLNVDGVIKDAQLGGKILLDLLDVNKDGHFSTDLDGSTSFNPDDEQAKKYARIFKLFQKALDKNNDDQITKEEVKEFANTAIKLIDINKDGKITDEECLQTLEQNNVSKNSVNFLRQQSQNNDITNAWKDLFHKIDAKNTKDGKLNAGEIVELLNLQPTELLTEIGVKMGPIITGLFQESPITADEVLGAWESFLKSKEFKQGGIENTNKEPEQYGQPNSSAISNTKVSVILVLTFASAFGAIM